MEREDPPSNPLDTPGTIVSIEPYESSVSPYEMEVDEAYLEEILSAEENIRNPTPSQLQTQPPVPSPSENERRTTRTIPPRLQTSGLSPPEPSTTRYQTTPRSEAPSLRPTSSVVPPGQDPHSGVNLGPSRIQTAPQTPNIYFYDPRATVPSSPTAASDPSRSLLTPVPSTRLTPLPLSVSTSTDVIPAIQGQLSLQQPSPEYDPSTRQMSPYGRLAQERGGLLSQPVPRERISERPGAAGRRFKYIEGAEAIALMNEVFTYHGWNSEVKETVIRSVRKVPTKDGGSIWEAIVYVRLRITLTVENTFHEGLGIATGRDRDEGLAIENGMKSAETDAMKRAVRQFGERVGLSLYKRPRQ